MKPGQTETLFTKPPSLLVAYHSSVFRSMRILQFFLQLSLSSFYANRDRPHWYRQDQSHGLLGAVHHAGSAVPALIRIRYYRSLRSFPKHIQRTYIYTHIASFAQFRVYFGWHFSHLLYWVLVDYRPLKELYLPDCELRYKPYALLVDSWVQGGLNQQLTNVYKIQDL
jgi:hypothetical protein